MVNVFIRQPIFAIVHALSTQIIAIFDGGCDAAVAAVAFPDERPHDRSDRAHTPSQPPAWPSQSSQVRPSAIAE
jgi:hypothetical protein